MRTDALVAFWGCWLSCTESLEFVGIPTKVSNEGMQQFAGSFTSLGDFPDFMQCSKMPFCQISNLTELQLTTNRVLQLEVGYIQLSQKKGFALYFIDGLE